VPEAIEHIAAGSGARLADRRLGRIDGWPAQQHRARLFAAVQIIDDRDIDRDLGDRLAARQHPRLADHDGLDIAVEIIAAEQLCHQLRPDPGGIAQQQTNTEKVGHGGLPGSARFGMQA
jgi:hypothetical protein